MRSTDPRRIDYFTADVPPTETEDLPEWLSIQLSNLANSIFSVNSLHVERMYKFPDRFKPREGDIILAAAGLVSAGSQAGMYYFDGDNWNRLDATTI